MKNLSKNILIFPQHLFCACLVASLVSDSRRPYGLQSARLLCSWRVSRQEYCSGLPGPSTGDLSNLGIRPKSHCRQILYHLSHSVFLKFYYWNIIAVRQLLLHNKVNRLCVYKYLLPLEPPFTHHLTPLGHHSTELYTLTRAKSQGQNCQIYTNGRYAFEVAYDFGILQKQCCFLISHRNEIQHCPCVRESLDAILFHVTFAIRVPGHSTLDSLGTEGTHLGSISSRNAANKRDLQQLNLCHGSGGSFLKLYFRKLAREAKQLVPEWNKNRNSTKTRMEIRQLLV